MGHLEPPPVPRSGTVAGGGVGEDRFPCPRGGPAHSGEADPPAGATRASQGRRFSGAAAPPPEARSASSSATRASAARRATASSVSGRGRRFHPWACRPSRGTRRGREGGPHREVLRDGGGCVTGGAYRTKVARARLAPSNRGGVCGAWGIGLAEGSRKLRRAMIGRARRIGGFSLDRAGIEGARHGPAVPPDAGRRRGRRRPAAAQPPGETRRLA